MELVPGRPLGQILNEQIIPLQRGLAIFDQILAALDAAHACAVIHGDVKSDHFLVEQQADGDVVTMLDFGLAQLDELLTGTLPFAGGSQDEILSRQVHDELAGDRRGQRWPGPSGAELSEPISRLVASLAALYELVGQSGKARRALACADGRATLVEVRPTIP
jgi:serine/threonine protein kinase